VSEPCTPQNLCRGRRQVQRLVRRSTRRPRLHHSVAGCGLAEPRGAELGTALLRLEVHTHQPEAVAEPVYPLEVVHRAPLLEVPIHRYPVGGRPLELRQAGAKEHDAVGVVDLAVVGQHVVGDAPVLGDKDLLRIPEGLHQLRGPVQRLRAHGEPGRGHLGVSLGERNVAPAGSLVGGQHVDRRLVNVDADEVQGRGDDLQILVGELRRVLAGILQVGD
jgi:hypothetical protein